MRVAAKKPITNLMQSHLDVKISELVADVDRYKLTSEKLEAMLAYERSREKRPLVYLACPYTHESSMVRQARFEAATRAAAALTLMGMTIFSPITHTHKMLDSVELPITWDFWQVHCMAYLACSHRMIVLQIPGWDTSKGVQAECSIAQSYALPIEYMSEI